MLKEFNPALAELCENLYDGMIDDIITDLLQIFPYRAIPEGNGDCEDFIEYLGKTIYLGNGTLRDLPEVNYEAGQFSRRAVEELSAGERFLADCFFAETEGRMPSDEDLHISIMENLDAVLYEIGRRVIEGE